MFHFNKAFHLNMELNYNFIVDKYQSVKHSGIQSPLFKTKYYHFDNKERQLSLYQGEVSIRQKSNRPKARETYIKVLSRP